MERNFGERTTETCLSRQRNLRSLRARPSFPWAHGRNCNARNRCPLRSYGRLLLFAMKNFLAGCILMVMASALAAFFVCNPVMFFIFIGVIGLVATVAAVVVGLVWSLAQFGIGDW